MRRALRVFAAAFVAMMVLAWPASAATTGGYFYNTCDSGTSIRAYKVDGSYVSIPRCYSTQDYGVFNVQAFYVGPDWAMMNVNTHYIYPGGKKIFMCCNNVRLSLLVVYVG